MTVVVGYLPGKGGSGALDLAAQLARERRTTLTVATVVPRQWSTPSLAKVDAEYVDFARQIGASAEAEGRGYLARCAPDIRAVFTAVTGRSVAAALLDAVESTEATALVLGSAEGVEGRITVGSTADRLLHSSPVPLAVAPRGYRATEDDRITRVTCAFSDSQSSALVVARVMEVADSLGVRVRVASFGIRGGTMFPPEVGLSAEDAVLDSWSEQAIAAQRQLVSAGIIEREVETVVATGDGWEQTLASIPWQRGELLALGSSSVGPLARVFLGSRATKLVRHSPVPVIVVPSDPEP